MEKGSIVYINNRGAPAGPRIAVDIEGNSLRGRCHGAVDLGIYCENLAPGGRLRWISGFGAAEATWGFNVFRQEDCWLAESKETRRELPAGEPRVIRHKDRPAAIIYYDEFGMPYVLATAGVEVRAVHHSLSRNGIHLAWRVPDGYLRSLIRGGQIGFHPCSDEWWEDAGLASTITPI